MTPLMNNNHKDQCVQQSYAFYPYIYELSFENELSVDTCKSDTEMTLVGQSYR